MKIFFSAGEASGDRFAAELAGTVLGQAPRTECVGIGSCAMAAAGVHVLLDVAPTASIGLTESLRHLLPGMGNLHRARVLLRRERPDLFVPVDSQGYNIPLARTARQLGIPVVYYIPPQNFFWKDVRTCRRIARLSDRLLCIYRQGFSFYSRLGADAVFVGHPLLDALTSGPPVSPSRRTVFIAPGSRRQELRRLLPVLLGAAALLLRDCPDLMFTAAAVDRRHAAAIRGAAARFGVPVTVSESPAREVLPGCALYLGKSGTVALEAALAGVPSVLLYKLSRISYFLLSRVAGLARRLPFIGLPNLITGKAVVPELIQKRASAPVLKDEAVRLLEDAASRERQFEGFRELSPLLGSRGAAERAAAVLLDFNRERG